MDKLIKTPPAILKASGSSQEVVEAACIAGWKHAVGEGLSSHAVPIQLQNQILIVLVADNIWQRQLEHMRGQLLFRLNSVLGQPLVKAIELRVDAEALGIARQREADASKGKDGSHAFDDNVPGELLTAAAGIQDVDLRRAFLGAAVSCVRRLENPKTKT
jgi:hypothetical protein